VSDYLRSVAGDWEGEILLTKKEQLKKIAEECNIGLIIDNYDVFDIEEILVWFDSYLLGKDCKPPTGLIFTGKSLTDYRLSEVLDRKNLSSDPFNAPKINLSEKFIKEFKDKINWYSISWRQILSEDFIIEFSDKIYCSNT
jgi:hypothetical protein